MANWVPALAGACALAVVAADMLAAMSQRPGGGRLSRFIVGAVARARWSAGRGSLALLAIPIVWLLGSAGGVALIGVSWAAAGRPALPVTPAFGAGLVGTSALCSAVLLWRVIAARMRRRAFIRIVDGLARTPEEAAAYLAREDAIYTLNVLGAVVAALAEDHKRDPVLHMVGRDDGRRLDAIVEKLRDACALLGAGGERRNVQSLRAAIAAYQQSAESLSCTGEGRRLVYHRSRGSGS